MSPRDRSGELVIRFTLSSILKQKTNARSSHTQSRRGCIRNEMVLPLVHFREPLFMLNRRCNLPGSPHSSAVDMPWNNGHRNVVMENGMNEWMNNGKPSNGWVWWHFKETSSAATRLRLASEIMLENCTLSLRVRWREMSFSFLPLPLVSFRAHLSPYHFFYSFTGRPSLLTAVGEDAVGRSLANLPYTLRAVLFTDGLPRTLLTVHQPTV